MKKLVFKHAATDGLAYPSGVVVEIKNDKEAQKHLDSGAARLATAKDLKENTSSKSAAKKENTSK